MRYPVDVYTGKIQAYPEGKPSAIAKIQVDGELMLTELGLEGDEQAEKRFTADQTERCVIILVSIISTGRGNFRNRRSCLLRLRLAKISQPTVSRKVMFIWAIFSAGERH